MEIGECSAGELQGVAHQRCRVEGWPWRMGFPRADAALIASMSFFLYDVFIPTEWMCNPIKHI